MDFTFGVPRIQLPDRTDREQLAVGPVAEEPDRRVTQPVDVERVHVLRRRVLVRERKMALEQPPHVRGPGVVPGDKAARPARRPVQA